MDKNQKRFDYYVLYLLMRVTWDLKYNKFLPQNKHVGVFCITGQQEGCI